MSGVCKTLDILLMQIQASLSSRGHQHAELFAGSQQACAAYQAVRHGQRQLVRIIEQRVESAGTGAGLVLSQSDLGLSSFEGRDI